MSVTPSRNRRRLNRLACWRRMGTSLLQRLVSGLFFHRMHMRVVGLRIASVCPLPLGHRAYLLQERQQVKVEVDFLKLVSFDHVHEGHRKLC